LFPQCLYEPWDPLGLGSVSIEGVWGGEIPLLPYKETLPTELENISSVVAIIIMLKEL
jgi:hypothetical protein